MAGLASSGARGAKSIAAASSYNGDDARRYLSWWKGTRDLYSEAIRKVGHLRLCLAATQAALAAAEGDTSAAWVMLSDADGKVAIAVLLSKHSTIQESVS